MPFIFQIRTGLQAERHKHSDDYAANEIAWTPCWPSCTWRPEDLAIFVNQYLGPQFEKDSIDTEIWMGTVNYPNPDYVRTFSSRKILINM